MRHRIPQFGHIFQAMACRLLQLFMGWCDQYGCVRGFTEGEGPYDKEVAKDFTKVLALETLLIKRMLIVSGTWPQEWCYNESKRFDSFKGE
jgi:hypothetical protein